MTNNDFRAEMRKLRAQNGITQQTLCKRLELSAGYMSLIELGRIGIKQHVLDKICTVYALDDIERAQLEKLADESNTEHGHRARRQSIASIYDKTNLYDYVHMLWRARAHLMTHAQLEVVVGMLMDTSFGGIDVIHPIVEVVVGMLMDTYKTDKETQDAQS